MISTSFWVSSAVTAAPERPSQQGLAWDRRCLRLRGQVESEDAALPREVAHLQRAVVGLGRLLGDRQAQAEGGLTRPRCTTGLKTSSARPGGSPPHASSTSMETWPSARFARRYIVELGRLNFSAFCNKFSSAECRRRASASIARSSGTETTISIPLVSAGA